MDYAGGFKPIDIWGTNVQSNPSPHTHTHTQVLASQKEEFQMKMESLAYRKDELEKKELRLRESLLKFDKFLEENDRYCEIKMTGILIYSTPVYQGYSKV